jgi:hypothetical protein
MWFNIPMVMCSILTLAPNFSVAKSVANCTALFWTLGIESNKAAKIGSSINNKSIDDTVFVNIFVTLRTAIVKLYFITYKDSTNF